ncbi:MAG: adenylate/guanylate cyclase domain-containing protein [Myxococcota bacterium]
MSAPAVLLVDDDVLTRRVLSEMLAAAGLSVTAVSSTVAMEVVLQRQIPDLCLIDVVLGEENGLTVLSELRRRPELARTALIGISGLRKPDLLATAFAEGADDFLFKPLGTEELLARARAAIARRRLLAPLGGITHNERREVTTLFCDVRGFTSLAAAHDPEWVVEMLNGLFERLVAQIDRRGGEVDKYLGDGLLAFFGTRAPGGDKELQAVDAARAMIAATAEYSRESLLLDGRRLSVGVGIATGVVVIAPVGANAKRQVTALGDAVNLASRLQGLAGEGEVYVCERTFQRVSWAVVTDGAQHVELKGVAGTPTVYRVVDVNMKGLVG